MEFNVWMQRVDAILNDLIGLCHRDIADKCWRDQYEDGATPNDAVGELVGATAEEAMANC